MANYKLTPAANADLKDIARYTERKWGREKPNRNLRHSSPKYGL